MDLGKPLRGAVKWISPAHGDRAHHAVIDAARRSIYISDGWGVSFSALRFRRLDLNTGAELARFRSGTAVRCFASYGDGRELVAATNSKLFRLGAEDLSERQRWERGVPRYANSIAIRGDLVVLANWRAPTIGILNMTNGAIRRAKTHEMTLVLDGPNAPLLLDGKQGGLNTFDPLTRKQARIIDTVPAQNAAASPDRTSLWLIPGIPAVIETQEVPGSENVIVSVGPDKPTKNLWRYPIDSQDSPAKVQLPHPVNRVVPGTNELWLVGEERLVTVPLPVGRGPARTWSPPKDASMLSVDPESRHVLTVLPDGSNRSAHFVCHELSD